MSEHRSEAAPAWPNAVEGSRLAEGEWCERCGSNADVQRVRYERDGRHFSSWWCAECKARRLVRTRQASRRKLLRFGRR